MSYRIWLQVVVVLAGILAVFSVVNSEEPIVIDPPDERAPAVNSPIDSQAIGRGNNIWSSEWFGTYWHHPLNWPWVYHFESGWVYIDYRFNHPDLIYAYFYEGGYWVYYERMY